MIRLFIIFCLLYCSVNAFSQAPDIQWQNTIGSNSDDILVSIHQTQDGGYILGGYSYGGISGDKTEAGFGFADYWLVKLNSFGLIEWQNTIGGNSNDILEDLELTSDGGYILCGYSDSGISGDKTEASLAGSNDYWVVRTDSSGNILWQNTIGGAGNDELHGISETTDGGYILGGRSNSPISGDKSEASDEYYDYWVIKINNVGNIEWENTIGGSEYDYLYTVCADFANGVLIGGYSTSPISGDKTEAWAGSGGDFWILNLDSFGNIVWQNTIGGDGLDVPYNITHSGNRFTIKGFSNSGISTDKTEESRGLKDYWTIVIDSVGNIIWQKTIGGSNDDISQVCSNLNNNQSFFSGFSLSASSGDKSEENIGFEDYWVVQADSLGNILWQKTIGGWLSDYMTGLDRSIDSGYILGGYSSSPISGNKTENSLGGFDYWVIKLKGTCDDSVFFSDLDGDGFGSESDSILACSIPDGYSVNHDDCNDSNFSINPSAVESCNGIDDNCNGLFDEGLPMYSLYQDNDFDGYGNQLVDTVSCLLGIPGYVSDSTDCDDSVSIIHEPILYYADSDGDSYGNALNSDLFCSLLSPSGYVTDSTDCNDENPNIYPGATEILNGIDDDCDNIIDEGLTMLESNSDNISINLSPNPFQDEINFMLNSTENIYFSISIFDLSGELIEKYNNLRSNQQCEIVLSKLSSGIYVLEIFSDSLYSSKLIIKK